MLRNQRDAFRGQITSPNMVQFDMLGIIIKIEIVHEVHLTN